MANITLGTLRDYWKRVYDAITGPPGSAAPTYAMQVGGSDGANLRALKTDADGHQQVDVLSLPGVDVTDRAARALGVVTAADGGIASIGAKADAAVADPTLSASEIALLKGLLKQLQGTGPVVTPVSLNGRKIALPAVANYDQALSVPPGGSTSIIITPPVGELWRLKLLYLYFPVVSGSTTGAQIVRVRLGLNVDYGNILRNEVANNLAAELFYNRWSSGTKTPAAESEQQRAVLNAVVSNAVPLYITYNNNTDATQTGTAIIRLLREVEYIVS